MDEELPIFGTKYTLHSSYIYFASIISTSVETNFQFAISNHDDDGDDDDRHLCFHDGNNSVKFAS